ncbi:MAG: hypothetical protein NVS3B28_29270 [Candidatus Velthaea sp.]
MMLAATAQAEFAKSAASFVDSIGINVHFSFWDTPYGKRFPEISDRLLKLGVRHVRDGVVLGQKAVCDEDRALAKHGLRFTYITQTHLSATDIATWASCVGPAIEAFEGPNEYDISHPDNEADWAQTLRTFQKRLYAAVKQNSALKHLTVVGPSVTSDDAARKVGDLSPYLDRGNMHDYFAGHEPETGGWGDNGYGSIAFNLRVASAQSGGKPVEATETGYQTQPGKDAVSEEVQAAYIPRMFMQQFASNVVRTHQYELLDEGGPPFAHFGLLRGDLTPKPAFEALRSLIATLSDTGHAAPSSLRYVLDGASPEVHHVLLEKSNGHFFLALWNGSSDVVPKIGLPLPGHSESVDVKLATGMRIVRVYRYDANHRLVARSVTARSSKVTVDGRIALVEIVPDA